MANWRDMTNRELRDAIKKICNACTSQEQVNKRANTELEYPYHIAVHYSSSNSTGGRMNMFMAYGHDDITLTNGRCK